MPDQRADDLPQPTHAVGTPRSRQTTETTDTRGVEGAQGGRVVRVPVRRAVNFRAFLVTGAIVGLLCGAIFAVFAPVATAYTVGSANVYCAAVGAVLGLLAGAVVALVLDRRS